MHARLFLTQNKLLQNRQFCHKATGAVHIPICNVDSRSKSPVSTALLQHNSLRLTDITDLCFIPRMITESLVVCQRLWKARRNLYNGETYKWTYTLKRCKALYALCFVYLKLDEYYVKQLHAVDVHY